MNEKFKAFYDFATTLGYYDVTDIVDCKKGKRRIKRSPKCRDVIVFDYKNVYYSSSQTGMLDITETVLKHNL